MRYWTIIAISISLNSHSHLVIFISFCGFDYCQFIFLSYHSYLSSTWPQGVQEILETNLISIWSYETGLLVIRELQILAKKEKDVIVISEPILYNSIYRIYIDILCFMGFMTEIYQTQLFSTYTYLSTYVFRYYWWFSAAI